MTDGLRGLIGALRGGRVPLRMSGALSGGGGASSSNPPPPDRDPEGQARAMDGHILNISKEDIADIITMNGSRNFLDTQTRVEDPPSIDGQSEFRGVLNQKRKRKPRWEYTETPTPTVADEASYSKAKIDEMVAEIYSAIRTSDDYHSKRLDDVYYPFDNSISWFTTCIDDRKQNIAMIQKQHAVGAGRSKSIAANAQTSTDADI
ncbi:hypothetical protein F2Q69_00054956 [Brassica cretica]|uniref:Uncharacterized protein n=1 Tax=Brassica cretica TaxID=69181 RepID=A0A8S9N5B3_BRACR|nr:hypothetical protein F2Q69_00054956 [Brassica cretica]